MKKGIELSLNFLVTVVIALMIFIFGVRFIYNITSEATQLQGMTFDELEKKIGELSCDTGDRVCISVETKKIPKRKWDTFGIRIFNILEDTQFKINIVKASPPGYTVNNVPIQTNDIILKYREDTFINRNDGENIAVGAEVPKNTTSGKYIFNVKIEYLDPDPADGTYKPYGIVHKLYVDVP